MQLMWFKISSFETTYLAQSGVHTLQSPLKSLGFIRSRKPTWLAWNSPCSIGSIGNTSSKGPFSIAMLVYQSVAKHIPSLKLAARTWKVDGWKTTVSFWVSAYFQVLWLHCFEVGHFQRISEGKKNPGWEGFAPSTKTDVNNSWVV